MQKGEKKGRRRGRGEGEGRMLTSVLALKVKNLGKDCSRKNMKVMRRMPLSWRMNFYRRAERDRRRGMVMLQTLTLSKTAALLTLFCTKV